jgi:glycine/D-amino acid oxidase-like deaminating enzyme
MRRIIFAPITNAVLGLSSLNIVLNSLTQEKIQDQLGRRLFKYLIIDNEKIKNNIPEEFIEYIEFVPQQIILSALNTIDTGYIAVAVPTKDLKAARINSAKLCHQLLVYLHKQFPTRFNIYENTEITKIDLHQEHAILYHINGSVQTRELILCTNGYTNFSIIDQKNNRVVTKLNDAITAREGYLGAYLDEQKQDHVCAFYDDRGIYKDVPYFYLSHLSGVTVLGGPEYNVPKHDAADLIAFHAQPSLKVSCQFLRHTFGVTKNTFDYFWHGTMGYTTNGLRWVGKDSFYPHLWYNLGCNGVGIVAAFFSGEKIARLLQGEKLPAFIFDPL